MNVGQLKQLLRTAPDETVVVIPVADHSYRPVSAHVTTALHESQYGDWTKDHGEELTPEADYGKRVEVLVIE